MLDNISKEFFFWKRIFVFERNYLDVKLPFHVHQKLELKKAVTVFDLMVTNSFFFLLSFSIFLIKLSIQGGSAGGYEQSNQYGAEDGQQNTYVEATIEPTEVTIGPGEKATIKCHVKGSQNYKVTWSKYAHDSTLPNYIHVSNSILILNSID